MMTSPIVTNWGAQVFIGLRWGISKIELNKQKILKQFEYESARIKKHVRDKTRKREEQVSTLPSFTIISLSLL